MTMTSSSARLAAFNKYSLNAGRTSSPAVNSVPPRSLSPKQGTRLFEVAALRGDGTQHVSQMRVPALPLFEKAFSAFARGSVLQTPTGEIAIEDLMPGDLLWTQNGGSAKVLWIGSGTFVPADAGYRTSLMRVMADSFGAGRPDRFITLGPHARILQTPPHLRGQLGASGLLTPASEFVDGVNVIEVVPPTPVHLFHIVLERHAVIRAGGLECETFHPGAQATRSVSHAMRDLFISLFPHVTHVSDFGPLAHPRAPETPVPA